MRTWKEGDPCLYEGTLGEVTSVEGRKVTGVSAGGFRTGGSNLLVIRATPHTEFISKLFRLKLDDLRALCGVGVNLNPGVYRALYGYWAHACDALLRGEWNAEEALAFAEGQVQCAIECVEEVRAMKFDEEPLVRL